MSRSATYRAAEQVAPGSRSALPRIVAAIQGLYFFLTGVWPLVSMETFVMVTGPKTDLWLVETVGVLVGVLGAALLVSAGLGRIAPETALLAIGSAVALAGIDVVHVSRGVIPPIYLADAAAEGILLLGWAAAGLARRR